MIKSIFHTFISKFMIAASSFLVAIIISQYMGSLGRGVQGIFITNLSLVLLACNLVGPTSIAYLAKKYSLRQLLVPSYVWAFSTSIIAAGFLAIMNYPLAFSIHIGVLGFISAITSSNAVLLIKQEKIVQQNYIYLLQAVILIFGLLAGMVFHITISMNLYFLCLYLSYIIPWLMSYWFIRHLFISTSTQSSGYSSSFKEMLGYGFWAQLSTLAQLAGTRLSMYFLGFYHQKQAVGIFSNGLAIAEAAWLLSRSFALILFSKVVNQNDVSVSKTYTLKMIKISNCLMLLALTPVILLPEKFYLFIFGPDFAGIRQTILLLMPGVFIYNTAFMFVNFFTGRGKYMTVSIITIISFGMSVIMSFLLIPRYGAIGAACVNTIVYIAITAGLLFQFRRETKVTFSDFIITRDDYQYAKEIFRSTLQGLKA